MLAKIIRVMLRFFGKITRNPVIPKSTTMKEPHCNPCTPQPNDAYSSHRHTNTQINDIFEMHATIPKF